MENVIKVNNVVWSIVDAQQFIIKRFGLSARLIFKTATTGIMLTRNVQNGRIRREKFVAA
jgi:hypothetical protein